MYNGITRELKGTLIAQWKKPISTVATNAGKGKTMLGDSTIRRVTTENGGN